jgi:pilus assembly protein Flp/PilA
MVGLLSTLLLDESGANAIEYALLAGLISLIVVTWATFMGTTIESVFQNISAGLQLA